MNFTRLTPSQVAEIYRSNAAMLELSRSRRRDHQVRNAVRAAAEFIDSIRRRDGRGL